MLCSVSGTASPTSSSGAVPQLEGGGASAADPTGAGGEGEAGEDGKVNKRSNLSFMKAVLPKYFSSEWSFAQFGLPPSAGKTLCAFGSDSHSFVRTNNTACCRRRVGCVPESLDAEMDACACLVHPYVQVVVTQDGEFYKCTFDPESGGACKNERYDKFVDDTTGGAAAAGAAGMWA